MITLIIGALLSFGQAAQPPIDVALLVDVSDSVTLDPFRWDTALVTDAAGALAQRLVAGDAVRIGTFGGQITILPPVGDPEALRLAASQLTKRLGGSSPLWDAVAEAAKDTPNGARRRGIILITDGRATGNRLGFADLLTTLQYAPVPVFVISLDPWSAKRAKRARPMPDPGPRLEQLAQATGGTCVFVERKALSAAVTRAVDSVRARTR